MSETKRDIREPGHRRVHTLSLLVFVWVLALPLAAGAQIIVEDLDVPGDGLIKRDWATGLDWLDLSATAAPPPEGSYSVIAILSDTGGWVSRGFRYATQAEVCTYLSHVGFVTFPCPGPSVEGPTATYMDLIGISFCCFGPPAGGKYAMGAYEDGGDPLRYGQAGYGASAWGSSVQVQPDAVDITSTSFPSITTHFLVRPSPDAPPGLPLLGDVAHVLLISAIVMTSQLWLRVGRAA